MIRGLAIVALLGLAYYWYSTQANSDAGDDDADSVDTGDSEGDVSDPTALLADYVTSTGSTSGTRGVQNNNPFNIKYNATNNWQGQTGSDGTFCIFDTAEDGYRAAFILVINWNQKYGLDTVTGIISKLAPSTENNTVAYIQDVANRLNVGPDDTLNMGDPNTLLNLGAAITNHEQGYLPWDTSVISAGLTDAFTAKGLSVTS